MKMSHVGIMVGEMDKAVEFYTKALGLEIVMGKSEVMEEKKTAIGKMCVAVFGDGFKGFNIAHLVTEDGVGFELFEMKGREEKPIVDFTKVGIFHFSLQSDDFQGVIDRTEQYGGKVRMDIMRYHPEDDSKPYKMVYLEDPFGNLFELYSHTYRETYSSEYE
jgi:catechol 2,3-dioxygenase-like lactoylglutathione lyase family enzyme